MLCVSTGSLLAGAASFFAAAGFAAGAAGAAGFDFGAAAAGAAPPCFSARAAANISATLSLPPAAVFFAAGSAGVDAAGGAASSAGASAFGAAAAPPGASVLRAAAKISATVNFLSAIFSPLCPDRTHFRAAILAEEARARGTPARSRLGARDKPARSPEVRYTATGYMNHAAAQAGDCDFFHNLICIV
jgi:hypothetical protein